MSYTASIGSRLGFCCLPKPGWIEKYSFNNLSDTRRCGSIWRSFAVMSAGTRGHSFIIFGRKACFKGSPQKGIRNRIGLSCAISWKIAFGGLRLSASRWLPDCKIKSVFSFQRSDTRSLATGSTVHPRSWNGELLASRFTRRILNLCILARETQFASTANLRRTFWPFLRHWGGRSDRDRRVHSKEDARLSGAQLWGDAA